jgi:hypothetical protein
MMENISLKELEKMAYRSTFQDGIWDVFLGIMLLNMAISVLLTTMGFTLLQSALGLAVISIPLTTFGLAFFILGKKYITVPRMGYVEFGPKRKRNLRKSILVLSLSAILGLVVFILTTSSKIPYDLRSKFPVVFIIFALNVIVVFSLLAYFFDFERLYIYAFLYAVPFVIGKHLQQITGSRYMLTTLLFISSSIMIAVGLIFFIRFLKKYPREFK